jgi:hypothetical protein
MARSPRAERAAGKRRRAAQAARAAAGEEPLDVARKRRRDPRAELDAFIARFPQPSPVALALSLAAVVLGNAYLLWRVWRGELGMSGIVVLVLAEGVLLSLLAFAQHRFVPPAQRLARECDHFGLPQRAIGWIAFVIGVGGAYAVWAAFLGETAQLRAFASSLHPWRAAGLHIALGATAFFALAGLVADHRHYRRAGPPFVSSVDLEATARRITFGYGALVLAIPLVGSVMLALHGIPRLLRGRDSKAWQLVGGLSVIAVFFGAFHALAFAVDSGRTGWASVYLAGKAIVESLFVLLPVLARRAARG